MNTSTLDPLAASARHASPDRTTAAVSDWRLLCITGGTAALVIAMLIPLQAIIFMASPPPESVLDYFALFQTNRLLGLLDLDLLMIIDQLLMVPILLALYLILRRFGASVMLISTALAFVAIAAYLASREATITLMVLSDQYSAAASEAQRAMLLGAGQALLASYNGTNFHISYNLGQFAGILISGVMLRSRLFGTIAPWAGILGNLVGWGLYVPGIGLYISLFSVIGLWVWYILIARRLLQLRGV